MTHTQTVALIPRTQPRSQGVLFHTLTEAQRKTIGTTGRAYALAHATGKVQAREEAEQAILQALGR